MLFEVVPPILFFSFFSWALGDFGYMKAALDDIWFALGSLWGHDAYMWGLGGAVFDLVRAR